MTRPNQHSRPWSKQDLHAILRDYPHIRTEDICRMLGRSKDAVETKAQELGVKKLRRKPYTKPVRQPAENMTAAGRDRSGWPVPTTDAATAFARYKNA